MATFSFEDAVQQQPPANNDLESSMMIPPSVQAARDKKSLDLLNQEKTNITDPKELAALDQEIPARQAMIAKNGGSTADPNYMQQVSFNTQSSPNNNNGNSFSFEDAKTFSFEDAQKAQVNPLSDAVGGIGAALDTILPLGSAVGGIQGLGSVLTGQGLNTAVDAINRDSQYNIGALLKKYYPEAYQQYQQAQVPMQKLGEAGQYVGEKAASIPLIGSPALGAAANVATQAIPFILGERLAAGTIKPGLTPEAKSYRVGAYEQAKANAEFPPTDTTPTTPVDPNVGGIMYGASDGTMVPERQLQTPFNDARQIIAEYKQAEADRLAKGTQSEFDFEPPSQPVYEKPGTLFDPDNINKTMGDMQDAATDQNAAMDQAKQDAIDKAFDSQNPAKDILGDEYDKALEQKQAQDVDPNSPDIDTYQPSQSGGPINISRLKSQRGSGDMFNDLAQGVAKVGDLIKDVTGRLGRVIGDDLNGYRVRTEVPGGVIYSTVNKLDRDFKVADTVQLPNNIQGTVRAILPDTLKVSVPRDGGFDLITVPKDNVKIVDRSTRMLGGVGKKGFGQGGAIGWKKIMSGADPGIEPTKPIQSFEPMDPDTIINTLYRHWDQSKDFDDFRYGLEREAAQNSAFPNDALNDAQQWYDKFQSGYRPESTLKRLSPLNQRETMTLSPYDQFTKETMVKNKDGDTVPLNESGKLGRKNDTNLVYREGMAPRFLATTNWERAGTKVIKWAYSKVADIRQQAGIVLNDLMNHKLPFMELSRADKIDVIRAAWKWDGDPRLQQMMEDQSIYWPTKDMLMKETGLSDKAADAYLRMADGYDRAYEIAGIDRPKLRGYFHHAFTGTWKVHVITPETGLIKVLPFETRWAANKALKIAKEEGAPLSKLIEPEVSGKFNFVNNTFEQIKALQSYGKLGKRAADMLIKIQDRVMQGTITESMERHGIGGWDFEKGPKPENTIFDKIFNRNYNNNMMKAYDQVMSDATRAWKNQRIVDTVARPFFEDIGRYDGMPNTVGAVKDLISKGTGFSAMEYTGLDKILRNTMIDFGLPPGIPTNIINFLNSYIRFLRTNSLNPGFAAEHFLFQGYGMVDLFRMHEERKALGEPAGDYFGSMIDWMKSGVPFDAGIDPETKQALQWYQNRVGLKNNYYDLPQFKGTLGKLGNLLGHGLLDLVINKSKKMTFTMAYNYFKTIEGMSRENALLAAENHTSKTMQSFDALDRPEILQEGIVGKGISPFNQIHSYNMARRLQALNAILDVAKKAPSQLPRMMAVAGVFIGMDLAFGGARGLAFHDDWDKLRKWVLEQMKNGEITNWNPDWFGSYENAMVNMHFPNWLTYGIVPSLFNQDIRGTFSTNVTNAFSAAGVKAGTDLASLSAQALMKAITGEGSADSEISLQRALSPSGMWGDPRPGGKGIGIPWIEDEAAKHLGGNIPEAGKLDPKSPRTPEEDLLYKITGKRPLSESIRDEKVDMVKDMDNRDAIWRQMRTRLIINKALGFNTGSKTMGQIMTESVNGEHGFDPTTMDDALIKALQERRTPAAITYLEKVAAEDPDSVLGKRLKHIVTIVNSNTDKRPLGK